VTTETVKLPKKRSRVSLRTPERFGARVRKARLELGLSLANVAGKDFSRAFLNQIELGRARPSTRTLQVIAERLQRPIEYFLQDPEHSSIALELVLIEAGNRLTQGDAVGARGLLTSFSTRSNVSPEMRVRAGLLLGEALIRLRSITEAIDVLRTAIADCERGRWVGLLVELYDRMGSAYYGLRHPHNAGHWWDKALVTYEEGGLSDPLLKARILGHRANLHYVRGAPHEAIAGYQAAIAAAEHVLDMQTLGGIYEGLALSFQRSGDLTRALEYAQRSLRLFETLQDVRMSAQLHNNMAEILLQQGMPAEAEKLFLEGIDRLQRVGDKNFLPHLQSGAAEAALEKGEVDVAATRIAAALQACDRSNDPLARLSAERIAGLVAQAEGRPSEARAHMARSMQLAETVDSPMEKSRIAYDYARVLEAQGQTQEAILHYREAYEFRRAISP
jgi:tetratricopeptide (TPR) repeat protein